MATVKITTAVTIELSDEEARHVAGALGTINSGASQTRNLYESLRSVVGHYEYKDSADVVGIKPTGRFIEPS